eukprot:91924-Rhodomonas_salina.1
MRYSAAWKCALKTAQTSGVRLQRSLRFSDAPWRASVWMAGTWPWNAAWCTALHLFSVRASRGAPAASESSSSMTPTWPPAAARCSALVCRESTGRTDALA